jgi:hypothetical protein
MQLLISFIVFTRIFDNFKHTFNLFLIFYYKYYDITYNIGNKKNSFIKY